MRHGDARGRRPDGEPRRHGAGVVRHDETCPGSRLVERVLGGMAEVHNRLAREGDIGERRDVCLVIRDRRRRKRAIRHDACAGERRAGEFRSVQVEHAALRGRERLRAVRDERTIHHERAVRDDRSARVLEKLLALRARRNERERARPRLHDLAVAVDREVEGMGRTLANCEIQACSRRLETDAPVLRPG